MTNTEKHILKFKLYTYGNEMNKITKLEDCYNLKEIIKQEEYPDPEINNAKFKNVRIAHQLILE